MTADTIDKTTLFQETEQQLKQQHFNISSQDQSRPWGGFL
jgi:mannose-6-phosphate isomerase